MISKVKNCATFLLAGALALPAAGALAQSPIRSIVGDWRGSYVCAQGKMGLTLHVNQQSGEQFTGYFHFYPLRSNLEAKHGCFSVRGRIDARGAVTTSAQNWITRPEGYVTVDLIGRLGGNGQSMSGAVEGPGYLDTRCKNFELSKKDSQPRIGSQCQFGEAHLNRAPH